MVSTSMISKCPTSVADISNLEKTYGPSMSNLKMQVNKDQSKVINKGWNSYYKRDIQNQLKIELCIGVLFINGVSFLVSVYIQVK